MLSRRLYPTRRIVVNINIEEYNIYIKPGITDLRKRAESLSFLVRNEMGLDPLEKSIFFFCSM